MTFTGKQISEWVVRHISFPMTSILNGGKGEYLSLRRLLKSQFLSWDKIRHIQLGAIKRLIRHAYQTTSFYRKRFDDAGFHPHHLKSFDDMTKIPILTKEDIRNHLDDLISSQFCSTPGKELVRSMSGGTTGPSIDFYNSHAAIALKRAAQIRFDTWSGWQLGEWMSIIWPATADMQSKKYTLKSRLRNYFSYRALMLQQIVLNPEDFQNHLVEIIEKKATVIRGFPFQTTEAAKYALDYHMKTDTLKGIITTGEMLYPEQRALVERAFGCKVFDSYRTREVGCIAQECEYHTGMHISSETVYVETTLVDKGQKIKADDPSDEKIIITDLTNFAMPFIRYEIGDIGLLSHKRCPCGRGLPLLKHVGGRLTDSLYTATGEKVSPTTIIPNLFHLIGIKNQFRVIQDQLDHLIIEMVKPAPKMSLINTQKRVIKTIFGKEMHVTYSYVDHIKPAQSGKYTFVVSKLTPSVLRCSSANTLIKN